MSPAELYPGSPRGCCPLLPKVKSVGLTERQCQLPVALLGGPFPPTLPQIELSPGCGVTGGPPFGSHWHGLDAIAEFLPELGNF